MTGAVTFKAVWGNPSTVIQGKAVDGDGFPIANQDVENKVTDSKDNNYEAEDKDIENKNTEVSTNPPEKYLSFGFTPDELETEAINENKISDDEIIKASEDAVDMIMELYSQDEKFTDGEGISKEGEVVDIGAELEIIQKSGSWYSYNNERIGQGRENVKQFLRENPAIRDEITEKIRQNFGIGGDIGYTIGAHENQEDDIEELELFDDEK